MKKKEIIYVLIFVVIVAAVVVFLPKNNSIDEIIEEDILNELEEELSAEIPEGYFDLLAEARDLSRDGQYNAAIRKIEEALDLHDGFQAYLALANAYDFKGDYSKKKDALYEVIYTHGNLNSAYWRNYIDALVQIDIDFEMVSSIYEDGIFRMRSVVDATGVSHLIDMYTGYAGYLAGNEYYAEAIGYLESAMALDPARAEIFNAEIDYYQGKI